MTSEKEVLTPDFCVIGAGSAGLSFAAGAAQMGAKVVLLENRKMGGDCLNYGCVPSKSLLAAAKVGHILKASNQFGWNIDNVVLDYSKVKEHIENVINEIYHHDSVERFTDLGVHVILEKGVFKDPKTVETNTYYIKPKKIIIATGSRAAIPPIAGLSDIDYYTNESIFSLDKLPKHIVIIGGGPIGIEIAQAFVRFGSQVTVLEAFTALPNDDPELTSILKKSLINEGVKIEESVKIHEMKKRENNICINYDNSSNTKQEIIASHVLVAAGRRANVENLKLENANVEYTSKGINVNSKLQTSNKNILALGDCTGGFQFTHVAGYHAGIAIRNCIFKQNAKVSTNAIPWVTYTDPELAHVGLQESQLKEKKIPHKLLRMNFTDIDRAVADKHAIGEIKVLVSPKGKILGVSILGTNAGELIFPWVMAIQNNIKISGIANTIAPYPTLSDINKRVAGSYYSEFLFGSFMKKIVKVLLRL